MFCYTKTTNLRVDVCNSQHGCAFFWTYFPLVPTLHGISSCRKTCKWEHYVWFFQSCTMFSVQTHTHTHHRAELITVLQSCESLVLHNSKEFHLLRWPQQHLPLHPQTWNRTYHDKLSQSVRCSVCRAESGASTPGFWGTDPPTPPVSTGPLDWSALWTAQKQLSHFTKL